MGSKVQNIILGVLAVGLIGLTVAYALLTQQLKMFIMIYHQKV